MKKKYIIIVVVIAVFYTILYYWNIEEKDSALYPTLHNTAVDPDDYLMEASEYEAMHRHDKSAYSIERAIQSIWRLEANLDEESFNRLEETIEKLETVHRHIIRDSVSSRELSRAFEYTLGNLAHAELEVAEKLSSSNHLDEARTALRYAQLHIKNALIIHKPNVSEDSVHLAREASLFDRMDSLLRSKDLSHEAYTASLDELISEVDRIITQIEK